MALSVVDKLCSYSSKIGSDLSIKKNKNQKHMNAVSWGEKESYHLIHANSAL